MNRRSDRRLATLQCPVCGLTRRVYITTRFPLRRCPKACWQTVDIYGNYGILKEPAFLTEIVNEPDTNKA